MVLASFKKDGVSSSVFIPRKASVVALSVNSMYTENPFFGNPLISPHSHNPSGHDSIQDIVRHNDGNDHCSIYAQSPFEDRLPDFINPMNNLGGSPRNFTHPDKILDVFRSCYSLRTFIPCHDSFQAILFHAFL